MSSYQLLSYASVWPWRIGSSKFHAWRLYVQLSGYRRCASRQWGIAAAWSPARCRYWPSSNSAAAVASASVRGLGAAHHLVGRRARSGSRRRSRSSRRPSRRRCSGSLLILRASRSTSATSGGTRREVDRAERLGERVRARVRGLGRAARSCPSSSIHTPFGHVDESEQLVGDVRLVDQRRMFGVRLLDERPRVVGVRRRARR